MSATTDLERQLIARYDSDETAFFIMTFEQEGVIWPPMGDRGATLEYSVQSLRISAVNNGYLDTYAYGPEESPIAVRLEELVGSAEAARNILGHFYDLGGHYRGVFASRRRTGEELFVLGEYHALRHEGTISGHVGLERDITEMMALRKNAPFN